MGDKYLSRGQLCTLGSLIYCHEPWSKYGGCSQDASFCSGPVNYYLNSNNVNLEISFNKGFYYPGVNALKMTISEESPKQPGPEIITLDAHRESKSARHHYPGH